MKEFWKSKTIWGIIVAVLPTVLRMAGVPLPPGVDDILVGIGGSLGVYGRVKAEDSLTLKGR